MVTHTRQLNGIAVCAGNGGLELGLKLALGDGYKTVCYIEREAYKARTLVERMENEVLDSAPIWDDITTFDSQPWRGLVDIISGGFPCQPHSSAGKRKGTKDERWIWDYIERAIGNIRPGIVFLENVPDLAFSGLGRVLSSLSEAGYQSVWDTFSAEETGAPHERERLFILSYADGYFDRDEQTEREARRNLVSGRNGQNFSEFEMAFTESDNGHGKHERRLSAITEAIGFMVDGDGSGCGQAFDGGETAKESDTGSATLEDSNVALSGTRRARRCSNRSTGEIVANSFSDRQPTERKSEPARRTATQQGSNFIFPPFRDDFDGWCEYLAERPDAKPAVLRGSDGLANRVDRIRSSGEGVVPLVVAYAFISLAQIAGKLINET